MCAIGLSGPAAKSNLGLLSKSFPPECPRHGSCGPRLRSLIRSRLPKPIPRRRAPARQGAHEGALQGQCVPRRVEESEIERKMQPRAIVAGEVADAGDPALHLAR